ncbi:MAG TPA: thioredoxin family protein [Ktedonobacteraceae bacterium]|nr:thioredoxin family protein [Ktedonobacteraceae bacterium]
MAEFLVRAGALVLVSMFVVLVVWSGRRFVEVQRRRALAAVPLSPGVDTSASLSQVRILAFSSGDCRQCHEMQIPALQRVLDARGSKVSVAEVDAPNSPDLTQRYRIMTLPSTVIMDASGRAHAVNYGFANTQRLLDQVDEVLALASVS